MPPKRSERSPRSKSADWKPPPEPPGPLLALVGVGEDVVGALDLLELRLVAAAVGVMLAGE